jgi:hypothetical protein
MDVKATFDGDWKKYWDGYTNVKVLKKWSSDMDQLLQRLEQKLEIKLLARDHFEIIEALEQRIEKLEQEIQKTPKAEKTGVQGELFPA